MSNINESFIRFDIWEKIINISTFSSCYSQKIIIAFNYLCSSKISNIDINNNDLNTPIKDNNYDTTIINNKILSKTFLNKSFTLNDFIDRGIVIIDYLVLNIEISDNSQINLFAIMDIFRKFDRSSCGDVTFENFLFGIISFKRLIIQSKNIITTIINEFKTISNGVNKLNEIILSIPSDRLFDKCPYYKKYFMDLHYLLLNRLDESSYELLLKEYNNNHNKIKHFNFIEFLLNLIINDLEYELLEYFRIPNKSLNSTSHDEYEMNKLPEVFNNHSNGYRILWNEPKFIEDKTNINNETNLKNSDNRNIPTNIVDKKIISKDDNNFFSKNLNLEAVDQLDRTESFLLGIADKALANYFSLHNDQYNNKTTDISTNPIYTRLSSILKSRKLTLQSAVPLKNLLLSDLKIDDNFAVPFDEVDISDLSNNDNEILSELLYTQQLLKRSLIRLDLIEMVQNYDLSILSTSDEEVKLDMDSTVYQKTDDIATESDSNKASKDVVKLHHLLESVLISDNKSNNHDNKDNTLDEKSISKLDIQSNSSRGSKSKNDHKHDDKLNNKLDSKNDNNIDNQTNDDQNITFEEINNEIKWLKLHLTNHSSNKLALGKFLSEDLTIFSTNKDNNLISLLKSLESSISSILNINDSSTKPNKTNENDNKSEIKISNAINNTSIIDYETELISFREQVHEERNENMKTIVEVQILKDKLFKFQKELTQVHTLEAENMSLKQQIQELISKSIESKKLDQIDNKHDENININEKENDNKKRLDSTINELRTKYHNLLYQNEEMIIEKEKLVYNNNYLTNLLKSSEDRIKTILNDQLSLHQQLQHTKDELDIAKSTISQLNNEINIHLNNNLKINELNNVINELKNDITLKNNELNIMKEETISNRKIKQQLISYEVIIKNLENKLITQSKDNEYGLIAKEQLDTYRKQISTLSKSNNELLLLKSTYENQLKSMNSIVSYNKSLLNELNEYKIKIEYIPNLLSEIARLRGSSKASIKALNEQDKHILTLQQTIKQLEKENIKLQMDNNSMLDLENKLKESKNEIIRLREIASEVELLKANHNVVEEEKRNIELQYKKIRKFMNQPSSSNYTNNTNSVSKVNNIITSSILQSKFHSNANNNQNHNLPVNNKVNIKDDSMDNDLELINENDLTNQSYNDDINVNKIVDSQNELPSENKTESKLESQLDSNSIEEDSDDVISVDKPEDGLNALMKELNLRQLR